MWQWISRWFRRRTSKPSYSPVYIKFATFVEEAAEQKLGRRLSAQEKAGIWEAGRLMMLESLDGMVARTTDPGELSRELIALGKAFKARRS
jgi:hypothetical protein